jgi:sulfite exporter TauE/SafE
MLIILGVINIISFLRTSRTIAPVQKELEIVHTHVHTHADVVHIHAHGHTPETHAHSGQTPLSWLDRIFGKIGLYQQLRPLVIGIVHGLAGSAAVALLILTTIRNPRWALVYLLVFGIGTIGGMMLITMSVASAFNFFGQKNANFSHWLGFASGVVSLLFGLFVAYDMGFAKGLFTGHPQWTPH